MASGKGSWPNPKSPRRSSDPSPSATFDRSFINVGFQGLETSREQPATYFPFPPYLPTMQSRFQVSASDVRLQSSPLNIQQACRLQQQLMAEFAEEDDDRKVLLGICAMSKKSHSKPMNEIIRRLVGNFDRLEIVVFDEDTILNKPVEEWPIVNGLVSFFSHGFPLDKAIAYKELRNPFIVNDLEMQYTLQDRRKVYAMMKENNIPHPRYAVLDREKDPDCKVIETEDSIEFNGNVFMKPFVEKPVDAEDHNIYIYFPQAAGGGSTRLFRKIKDRSSVYLRFCRVRSQGSFLYEDFMPTDGTDVKVYTVGPDYQHAEARKSPALDGKVERDAEGKEIRYPVLLANREKMIAKSVCKVFKQNVCGFDLLRANGQHYVCDVNGFSFVKTSGKYYDDCAKILGTLVMRACCPQLHIPYPLSSAPEDIPVVQTTSGSMMELRSVIAVIRHGDRTPKQKMKMEVKNKRFFQLFEKYGGFPRGHLKLKKPKQLQEVLDIVRDLLAVKGQSNADPEVEEKRNKLNQLKLVLEMYGHFSGINRKVQLKYQPMGRPKRSSSDEDEAPRDPSLLLILKWGGELTPAGRIQAQNLGKAFRTLYPGGQGQFEAPGLGFLRLHSTFRHDLKIYASDEGRVQMTAAAFTKGLLALEGELTPILVQMVKSANTNGLLDGESVTSKYQMVVKEKLKDLFNEDRDFTEEDHKKLAATDSMSLVNAMQFVKNPFQMCCRVHEMIKEITARIRCLKMELKSRDLLFNGESWELLIRRWAKLEKDFHMKNGRFDISKIPDVYDCIKYDLQHNQSILQFERAQELFMCSKALADIVIPQEYGITSAERLHIGQNYCMPLMRKIRCDLLQCVNEPQDESATRLDSKYSKGVASPERFVRTRLYFTSESHIHSMLSMLRYGGFLDEEKDEQWKRAMDFMGACAELNYMSQIVIMMFEDPAQEIDSDERFHVELHFSPGAYTSCDQVGSEPKGMGFRPKLQRESTNDTASSSAVVETTDDSATPDLEGAETPFSLPHFTGPSSTPPSHSPGERQSASHEGGGGVRETLREELFPLPEESPIVVVSCERKKNRHPPKPRSPDPDTPEWDWGDEEGEEGENKEEEEGEKNLNIPESETKGSEPVSPQSQDQDQAVYSQGASFSLPESDSMWKHELSRHKSITSNKSCTCGGNGSMENISVSFPKTFESFLKRHISLENDVSPLDNFGSSDSNDCRRTHRDSNKTHPIQIAVNSTSDLSRQSGEDKRSRSLEDGCCDISCKQASVIQRNYKTIHLPLNRDFIFRPQSHFLFFNHTPKALEGFNKVPLLHPLETLHNNLTFHQVDDFLGRVTTQRFPIPDMSALNTLASKVPITSDLKVSDQLPPSSNSSSGGPNSPTSSNTPVVDLWTSLGMYIANRQDGEATTSTTIPTTTTTNNTIDTTTNSGNPNNDQSTSSTTTTGGEEETKGSTTTPSGLVGKPVLEESLEEVIRQHNNAFANM